MVGTWKVPSTLGPTGWQGIHSSVLCSLLVCSDNTFGLFRVIFGWSYIIIDTAMVRREEGGEESKKGGRKQARKKEKKEKEKERGTGTGWLHSGSHIQQNSCLVLGIISKFKSLLQFSLLYCYCLLASSHPEGLAHHSVVQENKQKNRQFC